MTAILTTIIAILTAGEKWLERPIVHSSALVFFVTFWTYIGIVFLLDREKPKIVSINQDLKYGLTFEGIQISVNPAIEDAFLQFSLNVRNYSSGPLKYEIEKFDIILERVTLPPLGSKTLYGYLARGGGKASGRDPFRRSDLSRFFGQQAKGTLYVAILYGNAEKEFVRKLEMNFDLYLDFTRLTPENINLQVFSPFPVVGFSNNITSEKDEWI